MDIESMVKEINKRGYVGAFSGEDIEFLSEWFEINDGDFGEFSDDGEKKALELLELTAKYKSMSVSKKIVQKIMYVPQPINPETGEHEKKRTSSELANRCKKRLLATKEDLARNGITPKGKQLMELIDDFLKNADDFFPNIPKITAKHDEIRLFLQSIKIELSAQKEYLEYFTISK